MEIFKLFIYILTASWFIYDTIVKIYVYSITGRIYVVWPELVISAVLGSASLAYYLGG